MAELTQPDIDDIVIIVEGTWRPLEPAQLGAWRAGLLGLDEDLTKDTIREIAMLGDPHPPTWAAFRANYTRAKNRARDIADTQARIDAPVVDIMRDKPEQSTYIRCCQAYCRKALKDPPTRWEYRDALFDGEWPDTEFDFEPIMRGIARDVDALIAEHGAEYPSYTIADWLDMAIAAYDPATFVPMPLFDRPHRTGKHFADEWKPVRNEKGQSGVTVDGDRWHNRCMHWHKPAEPCPGMMTDRYEPPAPKEIT